MYVIDSFLKDIAGHDMLLVEKYFCGEVTFVKPFQLCAMTLQ